jgi:RimJ/RimL family protein N-acetyltransferase
MVRAVFLVFNYVFTGWPFRKIYLETPAFNLEQIESAVGSVLTLEATLTDYVFADGRYWDQHFLSITRESWNVTRLRYARFMAR